MRAIAALLIALGLAASLAACKPGGGDTTSADMSLGPPTAKVTVVEYASLGCPICAKWNTDNFSAFKAKYVDTGKVHYVLKEMLTGDESVSAAGFLLARCAGKDKYFQVVDAVFRQEADLLESGKGAEERDRLLKIAESSGLTDAQFNACVDDDKSLTALNKRVNDSAQAAHIDSTPTFVVNGKALVGYQDMPALDKAIADAGAAKT
ncbi:MAG TPA: DsbA family protein [Caulobacteraceae bacterium]|jgi:protein-disulfide isomerase